MASRGRHCLEVRSSSAQHKRNSHPLHSRAAIVNARVRDGDTVLITGIGGGVALLAMQLCLAHGAAVYVTSGRAATIAHAVKLGARGGVIYKDGASQHAYERCLYDGRRCR